MGVLACDRSNCPEIMCNRMEDGLYICESCFDELEKIKSKAERKITKAFFESAIEEDVMVKVEIC